MKRPDELKRFDPNEGEGEQTKNDEQSAASAEGAQAPGASDDAGESRW